MKTRYILALMIVLSCFVSTKTEAKQPLHLAVYVADESGWRVTSTLIYGKTESILVDTQYLKSHAAKLADQIAATGTRLKAIIITHPHDDHYMGAGPIHDRFPDTPIYMSPEALESFKQKSADTLAGMKKYQPAEAPDNVATVAAFPSTTFTIDGEDIEVRQGQGDESKVLNSFVWIPSLRAIIAGDMVFNGVHVWLTNSDEQSRAAWLKSLEILKSLHPRIVVAGHKRDAETKDTPDDLEFTSQYIRDFEASRKASTKPEELVAAMKAKYPDLALADKILTRSAKRAFPKPN